MVASAHGNMEMVKTLLYAGADINAGTPEGVTALLYAVHRRQQATVEYLVEKGADINHADQAGNTPLMVAILKQDMPVIRFLIDHGADVNAREGEEKGVKYYQNLAQDLHAGYSYFPDGDQEEDLSGEEDTSSSVTERVQEEVQTDTHPNLYVIYQFYKGETSRRYRNDFYWRPPLWLAIDYKSTELMVLLLKNKADFTWVLQNSPPEGPLSSGVNILMYAAYWNNCDVLDKLIRAGFDVNARKEGAGGGKNVLYYAIEGNAPEAVKLLYKAGTDHTVNTFPEQNALMLAVESPDRYEMAKLLVGAGEKINAQNKEGITALMVASGVEGNHKIVKWLLEQGANVNARSNEGESALSIAMATDITDTKELLIKYGAN
jgi:ankyrin repeat protein